jgi:DNA helicase-2/ATP-dependent DNA helicase PcrA
MDINPRPHQKKILKYTHGTMGISAVPGSGKTWTLSALAAQLIERGYLGEGQEILIVTLTNSAVDNFAARINDFLSGESYRPLLPAYRVRTLHGLAHDIVRERPELVSLDVNFSIIDERAAEGIRKDIVRAWLHNHPYALDDYINPDMDENRIDWVRREQLPKLVESFLLAFIRTAKDMQCTPQQVKSALERLPTHHILAFLGAEMYMDYQRALAYRGAVDFDDLIRLALSALESDSNFLERLQFRWPFILEDEAQDSSQLQEEILRHLVGEGGNWVRVGDPNQAIFESFTTANPKHLRDFMQSCHFPEELPSSGRSTASIILLANFLNEWTSTSHPLTEVRNALQQPYIQPAPPGDPQPNPPDQPSDIYLVNQKYSPQGELEAVAGSVERWLATHPEQTVAVLVPRNQRGFALIDLLRNKQIEVVDSLLKSSSTTRLTAGALGNLLVYLEDPGNPRKLARVFEVWLREDREDPERWDQIVAAANLVATCVRVEDYIWPRTGRDWLAEIEMQSLDPFIQEALPIFREYVRRWQGTVLLPVNQIILTLAQDLFGNPVELAIAHKLAVLLRQAENANQDWRLGELANELAVIAKNERRFLGFSDDDSGFDPQAHKGKVVVATIHKAKGLEWDRIYLMSANNYDFPSGMPHDRYIPERWFIRNNLNLEAEGLAQLEDAIKSDPYGGYEEGRPTIDARLDYIRERIRLLYVGITRAKKELVITWNTGRNGALGPTIPLVALQHFWDEQFPNFEEPEPA